MFASLHTARLTLRQVQKGGTPGRLARRLGQAFAAWRQRRHLARLDAHALRDIGLTCDQARREADRPLWDVPPSWRR